ncbi:Uncharacterised protein [Citrobacter freundii]|jgi:hypothetical protein|nr:Uncharacterised protein [Citrobacter freundii]
MFFSWPFLNYMWFYMNMRLMFETSYYDFGLFYFKRKASIIN